MNLHPTQIIKRPLITEKSTWEAQARNRYAFEVDIRANKKQIAEAVAKIYNVRVVKVATMIRKGEYRQTRWGEQKKPDWKKAVVQLHPEDKIELL